MPRYCAVKLCKNRGGVLSKDNKRISFYPFPLRDEARLRKWVYNMKREQWTPSRHQYLCSDHFTEDSFDLRWGIRYLKHNAVPTIFPFIYDGESSAAQDELRKLQNKKSSKPKPKTSDTEAKHIRVCSPTKKGSLILKEEEDGVTSARGALMSALGGDRPSFPTELFLTELDSGGRSTEVLGLSGAGECLSDPPEGESELTAGDVSGHSEASESPASETQSPKSAAPDASQDRLQAAISQAISALPMGLHSVDGTGIAEGEASNTEHNLLDEHSYSRQDTDKEQLWSKIASLHVKIMELEKREEITVAKISSLENTITHLRKENVVCEEKQKALEDYFTSVFL